MTEAHNVNCRWQRVTSAECAFRDTHNYCPHPEHACTCPPRTKSLEQHLDERMITANDVLGFLLAAIEGDKVDTASPTRLYVQLTPTGGTISHIRDPREVYDNGRPVYIYIPRGQGMDSATAMLIEIATRRKRAGTLYASKE